MFQNKALQKGSLKIIFILILLLLAKISIAAFLPLFPDEAYYWIWSLKPQLSYFDHPPFVSWLLWLGPRDWPIKELVRWPAVVFGHSTLVIWYFIFKEIRLNHNIKSWLWLILACPLLGLGSLIVTPDLPLIVFWSLATLFFIRLLKHEKKQDALFLGLSLGLGFTAKYMMALFIPCVLLHLFIQKKWKPQFFSFFVIVALTSIVASLPVFIWNFQNDFASFRFQLGHGLKDESWDWRWPLDYLLGQAVLLIPFLNRDLLKARNEYESLFKILFLGPLIFFFITSFRAHVELNWPVMSLLGFFALVTIKEKSFNKIKIYSFSWISIYLFIFFQASTGRHEFVHEKIQEPFLYKKLASELTQKYKPIYGINYQISSLFWFYSGRPVYKISQASRYDFFDTFIESQPSQKMIYVLKQEHHDWPEWVTKKWDDQIIEKLPLRHEVHLLELK